jgi:hypothetical protein
MSRRITVTFTAVQNEHIEKLLADGLHGRTKSEIVKRLIDDCLKRILQENKN